MLLATLLLVNLGFVYNFTGILWVSVAFGLARRWRKFAKAFVSQETYDKYIGYLDKNDGKYYFAKLPGQLLHYQDFR